MSAGARSLARIEMSDLIRRPGRASHPPAWSGEGPREGSIVNPERSVSPVRVLAANVAAPLKESGG